MKVIVVIVAVVADLDAAVVECELESKEKKQKKGEEQTKIGVVKHLEVSRTMIAGDSSLLHFASSCYR